MVFDISVTIKIIKIHIL